MFIYKVGFAIGIITQLIHDMPLVIQEAVVNFQEGFDLGYTSVFEGDTLIFDEDDQEEV